MNTHDIFDVLSKKVGGGDISYVVPTELKSGGTRRPPPPSPTDLRPWVEPAEAWIVVGLIRNARSYRTRDLTRPSPNTNISTCHSAFKMIIL